MTASFIALAFMIINIAC